MYIVKATPHHLILQTLLLLHWQGYAFADNAAEISADTLSQQIDSDKPPVILDTRSSFEYRRGHIPGAQHFPFWLSYMRADDLKLPKNQPVVVYCAHGPRAVFAKGALKKNGYSNIRLLKGHMTGWKKAKLPVE